MTASTEDTIDATPSEKTEHHGKTHKSHKHDPSADQPQKSTDEQGESATSSQSEDKPTE